MKITSVETFPISLRLAQPIHMSHHTFDRSDNLVVRVSTDTGIVGWGEGVPSMDVTGENQASIGASVEDLGSRLVGDDPLQRTALWLKLRNSVYGNSTAIGAIDIALHDIAGKALGVSVSDLLGGAARESIPALTLMGSGDRAADLDTVAERKALGLRWFKLKVGMGDPDLEAETMALMAEDRDLVVCGDANGGFDEQRSARFLAALGGSHVRFMEQPTLSTAALIRLAEHSPVAVCADESARSLDDLVTLGATPVAGVSLKLIKHGGITGVMRGAAVCDQVGLQINLAGKVAESAISTAANLHCAAAMSGTPFGCSPSNQNVAADVCADAPTVIDGAYRVPTGPGLGIDVDEDRLRSLATP